ncbi:DUF4394 domain-containing protein [Sphingomonas sp. KR1UV-12]|uniref:DUF4394 domain-containing protein n=1 Tax=Sphingomonas aurea TaxID=3063994 RepID=A0ABT9EMW8_9SPHN|nr:DUF4394 domain-containing protein [Sphingomonas sp. KR1UV-12]MDP1028302.1 DUF4394 domain-containing protein [Sphingomonas sp. KR1UV-12]
MKPALWALAIGVALSASGAQAATIYGVDETNNLVSFDSANPSTFSSSVKITGLTNSIQALDFRPVNGALYGLGSDKTVYMIDTGTGAATAVGGALAITGTEFAFDFNPTIDRLRIVSNTNQNYVFDPNTGGLTTATSVFYAEGDVNAGRDADVTGGAYTSSTLGAAAGTTQLYGIDTALDVLVRQANSAGTLTTVGATGVDLGSRTSFDIAGSDAFAFNGSTLYRVDLNSGAFSQVGTTGRALFGIAISPVPEASTWAMMLVGFGMVAGAARYRSRRVTAAIA